MQVSKVSLITLRGMPRLWKQVLNFFLHENTPYHSLEQEAVTLEWLRVTLVVKRAHISSNREKTVPGMIANSLAATALWLSFKRKLEFPEEGSNYFKRPLLSVPEDENSIVSCQQQPRDGTNTVKKAFLPKWRWLRGVRETSDVLNFPQAHSTRNLSTRHMAHHRHILWDKQHLKPAPAACSLWDFTVTRAIWKPRLRGKERGSH